MVVRTLRATLRSLPRPPIKPRPQREEGARVDPSNDKDKPAPADPRLKMMPNDIDTFAHYVEGIDPSRYFDSQARERWQGAMTRWPLLAAVLYPQPPDENKGRD